MYNTRDDGNLPGKFLNTHRLFYKFLSDWSPIGGCPVMIRHCKPTTLVSYKGNPRESKLHTTAARRAQTEPTTVLSRLVQQRSHAQSLRSSHSWGPTYLVDGCRCRLSQQDLGASQCTVDRAANDGVSGESPR